MERGSDIVVGPIQSPDMNSIYKRNLKTLSVESHHKWRMERGPEFKVGLFKVLANFLKGPHSLIPHTCQRFWERGQLYFYSLC